MTTHTILDVAQLQHQNSILQTRVSELEHQLASLQTNCDHLEQSLETTPLAVIEWDLDGTIRRWNASATRIFGWLEAEALGQNTFTLIIAHAAQVQVQRVIAEIVSGQNAINRNLNVTRDGNEIMCQWYNAPIYDASGAVIGMLSQAEDVTDRLRAEEERQHLQQQVIDAQQDALRELSTPLIPLANNVVVMPLVGAIDGRRAQQILETLLNGVADNHARTAILDITGVQVVDTQVANALLRAAQAVQLLGAQVVLTGIRPEIAQTLISLGVTFAGIITRNTLQSGITYALEQHTRAVR